MACTSPPGTPDSDRLRPRRPPSGDRRSDVQLVGVARRDNRRYDSGPPSSTTVEMSSAAPSVTGSVRRRGRRESSVTASDMTRFRFRALDAFDNQRPYPSGDVALTLAGPATLDRREPVRVCRVRGVGGGVHPLAVAGSSGTVTVTAQPPAARHGERHSSSCESDRRRPGGDGERRLPTAGATGRLGHRHRPVHPAPRVRVHARRDPDHPPGGRRGRRVRPARPALASAVARARGAVGRTAADPVRRADPVAPGEPVLRADTGTGAAVRDRARAHR